MSRFYPSIEHFPDFVSKSAITQYVITIGCLSDFSEAGGMYFGIEQCAVTGDPDFNAVPQGLIHIMRGYHCIGFAQAVNPVTGPWIVLGVLHDAGPDGVQFNIAVASQGIEVVLRQA